MPHSGKSLIPCQRWHLQRQQQRRQLSTSNSFQDLEQKNGKVKMSADSESEISTNNGATGNEKKHFLS